MGFRLGRTYLLEFGEGTYLAGAEIRMRSASIDTVLALETKRYTESIGDLMAHVQDWNLETEEGHPLPLTEEALRMHMELAVLKRLVQTWYEAASGASVPLDLPAPPSSAGQSSQDSASEEQLLPMEVLSESP
jgi:hypothetical protein